MLSLSVPTKILLLAPSAAAPAVAHGLTPEATSSVECTAPTACKLVAGRSAAAVAWGRFDDTIASTGAARLWVTTRAGNPAPTAAFAAGYLEGALSSERIYQQYSNFVQSQGVAQPGANLTAWLNANAAWLEQQIAAAPPDDKYWSVIAWQRTQLAGLAAGYNAHRRSSGPSPLPSLTLRQLEILNLQGDLSDLLKATEPSRRPHPERMTAEQLARYTLTSTHCSALVKLTANFSELYVGHNMWWGYYTMLAVVKQYTFPGQLGGAADSVTMTSYPGLLASTDDYYLTRGGAGSMVVLETTNPNYNASSYDLVLPTSVLYWQRVMAANFLAGSGPEWMRLAALHNSGTYNNMWMVVDYKLFIPGRPLAANTFWVGEQAPGWWHAEDQTRALSYGYWPSYNKALYAGTAERTGQEEMVRLHGNDYSYSLTPRAAVFRRDEGLVADEASMQTILRYNRYQTDPLAKGSPCNQLACRGDLMASPLADGAVNAKFTSSARLAKGQMLFVAGPTHDDQPVFAWSKAPAAVQQTPHVGQPDVWDFGWATYGGGGDDEA